MDYAQIEALAAVLSQSTSITELEIRQEGVRLRLRRPAPPPKPRQPLKSPTTSGSAAARLPKTGPSPDPAAPHLEVVTANYVGIFHVAQRSPVSVGDTLAENQILGHIETMRLLNDCIAPVSGRLQAILVMDGQPVEYGQPLFEIAPEES